MDFPPQDVSLKIDPKLSFVKNTYKSIFGNNPCSFIEGLFENLLKIINNVGVNHFNSTKIYAQPDNQFLIRIYSNSIEKFHSNLLEKSKESYEFEDSSQYYIFFKIKINPCQIGEIFRPEINRQI